MVSFSVIDEEAEKKRASPQADKPDYSVPVSTSYTLPLQPA